MLGCCMESMVLINMASEERENEKRIAYTFQIHENIGKLLVYTRVANELHQLGKENAYFFLSEKILDILLSPISIVYIILIAFNSFLQNKFGGGIYWKGRTYQAESKSDELIVIEDENVKLKAGNH